MSPSMAVAILALFVALGGSAYAASQINGSSIKKNSIPGNRLKSDTVTGTQINVSTLGTVPSATNATTATTATTATSATNATNATNAANATTATTAATATNATELNGLTASHYLRSDTCDVGGIRGYGSFDPSAMSASLSTSGVTGTLDCAGGTVVAKAISTGYVQVSFPGYPGGYVICQPEEAAGDEPSDDVCGVSEVSPGVWNVTVWNVIDHLTNDNFILLLY